MLETFLHISVTCNCTCPSTCTCQCTFTSPKELLENVTRILIEADTDCEQTFRTRFNVAIAKISDISVQMYSQFKQFIQTMARKDDTWRFWVQYVFVDAMAYISLFLAIRSGDWHLRMSSVKSMAPIFTAFDHPTYQKLISNHISDILSLPQSILLMFEQGGFVVNISGRSWHSVGIDESHEMLINKHCKMAITKPTPDYISRIAKYVTYRMTALQHMKGPVFKSKQTLEEIKSVFSSKPSDNKLEQNIKAQMSAILSSSLLNTSESARGLVNPFTNAKAQDQTSHDLLNFRRIGEEEYLIRISYFTLRNASVNAPNRRRTLQTFSTKKGEQKTNKSTRKRPTACLDSHEKENTFF